MYLGYQVTRGVAAPHTVYGSPQGTQRILSDRPFLPTQVGRGTETIWLLAARSPPFPLDSCSAFVLVLTGQSSIYPFLFFVL